MRVLRVAAGSAESPEETRGNAVEGLAPVGGDDHDLAAPVDREGKPSHVARRRGVMSPRGYA